MAFTNFITSINLCQYQLAPKEHTERDQRASNAKEVLRGSLGPSSGFFWRQKSTMVEKACWRSAKGKRTTGQALVMILKRSKGAKFHGIVTPELWHSLPEEYVQHFWDNSEMAPEDSILWMIH